MTCPYTRTILTSRYNHYLAEVNYTNALIAESGMPIRAQNPPEDITENLAKFMLLPTNPDIVWAKACNPPRIGDLYSPRDGVGEVKAFTSDGPSSFGPDKKFKTLYFLDMRHWLNDRLTLWHLPLADDSPIWQGLRVNKTQTFADQAILGRRPHISFDNIYRQIPHLFVKVYDGTFEDIWA